MFRTTEHLATAAVRLRGFESRHIPTSVGSVHAFLGEGSGHLPPILLLHGLASAASDYLLLIRGLRTLTRGIIAVDLPGHGNSPRPATGMDAASMRSALSEALDQLITEPMLVVGNSFGGIVAIRYAAQRPQHVAGLVLLSPGGAPMAADDFRSFMNGFHFQSHAQAADFVDRFLARRSPLRAMIAMGLRQRFSKRSIRELINSLDTDDLLHPDEVSSLAMPLLFFWGAEDRVLPRENLDFFLAHLPSHAQVVLPAGFGHAPFMDQPREFLDYLAAFGRELVTKKSA